MRMISGALLLLSAEQAFSHSLMIGFPNAQLAKEILYPASIILLILGIIMMSWGLVSGEFRQKKCCSKKTAQ